jgi:prevent-host-death family protein
MTATDYGKTLHTAMRDASASVAAERVNRRVEVTITRNGKRLAVWMTAEEARDLAARLEKAADSAEDTP